MAKSAVKKANITDRVEVQMRGMFTIRRGDIMTYPYNVQVSAGEPSEWKNFHAKYHGQECIVIGFSIKNIMRSLFRASEPTLFFKVKFGDGVEKDMHPDALIFVRRGKKSAKKK